MTKEDIKRILEHFVDNLYDNGVIDLSLHTNLSMKTEEFDLKETLKEEIKDWEQGLDENLGPDVKERIQMVVEDYNKLLKKLK